MTQPKLRLLLLSVGALSAQNVIDAIGGRRERCVILGTNSVADSAGNFRCDVMYLVPPAASGAAYIESIAALIHKERPDLVIPCRDDDVLALAVLGEQSPRIPSVLLTGSVAAARVMNDKVETSRFARRHGLPFAPTAETVEAALDLARTHRLPLIGKPRAGNASHGVVLLRSTDEIERAFRIACRPDRPAVSRSARRHGRACRTLSGRAAVLLLVSRNPSPPDPGRAGPGPDRLAAVRRGRDPGHGTKHSDRTLR